MFKGKIHVWIITIGIMLFMCLLYNEFINLTNKDTIKITYTQQVDENLYNLFFNTKSSHFKLDVTKEITDTTDIIFTSTQEINKKGYTKIDNALSTPIVLYANYAIYNSDDIESGFTPLLTSNVSNSPPYKVDGKKIFDGFIESKTWEDLGINKKIYSGDISIVIPDESSIYYPLVVDTIYLVFNDYNVPSQAEKLQLKTKVDLFLSKCIKSSNIVQAMLNYQNNNEKLNKVFIAPENCYVSFKNQRQVTLGICYLQDTLFAYMDMYIKDDSIVGNEYYEYLKSDSNYFEKSGWRVTNKTYSVRDSGYRYSETVPSKIKLISED